MEGFLEISVYPAGKIMAFSEIMIYHLAESQEI